MAHAETPFEERVRRLMRKHSRMAHNGVVHRIGADGLIITRPRRRAPAFPLRGLVILLGAAFLFKSFLYAWLGASVYAERVALLQSGSLVEQGGAWLMQADPVTIWIAALINGYMV